MSSSQPQPQTKAQTQTQTQSSSSLPQLLIRPSISTPWDVQVMEVVPKEVKDVLKDVYDTQGTTDWKVLTTTSSTSTSKSHENNILYCWKDEWTCQTFFNPSFRKAQIAISKLPAETTTSASAGARPGASANSTLYVFARPEKLPTLSVLVIPSASLTTPSSTSTTTTTPPILQPPKRSASAILPFPTDQKITAMLAVGTELYMGSHDGTLFRVTTTARPVTCQLHTFQRRQRTTTSYTYTGAVMDYVFGSKLEITSIQAIVQCQDQLISVMTNGVVEQLRPHNNHNNNNKNNNNTSQFLVDLSQQPAINGPLQVLQASGSRHNPYLDLIAVCRRRHSAAAGRGRRRLYWYRYDLSTQTLVASYWLNRFPSADDDDNDDDNDDTTTTTTTVCRGCVTAENGCCYAAFEWNQSVVTLVSMMHHHQNEVDADVEVQELELPSKEAPSLVYVGNDQTTHGIILVTTTGLVLRARRVEMEMQTNNHRSNTSTLFSLTPTVGTTQQQHTRTLLQPSKLRLLADHVRTAFEQWARSTSQQQQQQPPLPPSIPDASPTDLEPAILLACRYVMDSSLAFIDFLKDAGLYKNVSNRARWALLGMGQEWAVHQHVFWKSTLLENLEPTTGAAAAAAAAAAATTTTTTSFLAADGRPLEDVQRQVQNTPDQTVFTEILVDAIKTAQQYREYHASTTYDVHVAPSPGERERERGGTTTTTTENLLWTHSIRTVLAKELPTRNEIIVRAALQAYQETEQDYESVKKRGIDGLQDHHHNDDDDLVHELSIEHKYYEGLCRLALQDKTKYALDNFITEWPGTDFANFVIQWFTTRGKISHVLRYGSLVPDTLTKWMDQDARLQPYRWIHAVRQDRLDDTCRYSWQDCQIPNTPLHRVQFSLGMAKLASVVVAGSGSGDSGDGGDTAGTTTPADHSRLRERIDNQAEIVTIQKSLLGEDAALDGPLKTPAELLQIALDHIVPEAASDSTAIINNKDAAMNGFGLAMAMDSLDATVSVWAKVIQADMSDWDRWLASGIAPTRDELLNRTLFGEIWQLVQESNLDHHPAVQFDRPSLEGKVTKKLGRGHELQRLLRKVTTLETQSIMVGRYP